MAVIADPVRLVDAYGQIRDITTRQALIARLNIDGDPTVICDNRYGLARKIHWQCPNGQTAIITHVATHYQFVHDHPLPPAEPGDPDEPDIREQKLRPFNFHPTKKDEDTKESKQSKKSPTGVEKTESLFQKTLALALSLSLQTTEKKDKEDDAKSVASSATGPEEDDPMPWEPDADPVGAVAPDRVLQIADFDLRFAKGPDADILTDITFLRPGVDPLFPYMDGPHRPFDTVALGDDEELHHAQNPHEAADTGFHCLIRHQSAPQAQTCQELVVRMCAWANSVHAFMIDDNPVVEALSPHARRFHPMSYLEKSRTSEGDSPFFFSRDIRITRDEYQTIMGLDITDANIYVEHLRARELFLDCLEVIIKIALVLLVLLILCGVAALMYY